MNLKLVAMEMLSHYLFMHMLNVQNRAQVIHFSINVTTS
jgi:hypothetical protein